MPEEVESCFSTCFLSILPFQKTRGKAAAAAAGVTVNFRAGTMLTLCHRGHCSPERFLGAGLNCSQRIFLRLIASSKTQRKSKSLGQQELSFSDTQTQVDRPTEGTRKL